MNEAYNFVMQMQLQGPSNLNAIRQDIQRGLSGISADVSLNVARSTTANLGAVSQGANAVRESVLGMNRVLENTGDSFSRATGGARGFSSINAQMAAGIAANTSQMATQARRLQTVTAATGQYSSATQQASRANASLGASSANLYRQLNLQQRQIEANTTAINGFAYQSGLAARRFSAFALSAGALITLSGQIRGATAASIDFNQQLVRLRQVSGDTPRIVREIGQEVDSLSTNLGVSSQALSQTSVTLKQAGISLRDVKTILADLAATELAPNFEDLGQTTEGVIAVMSQFETPANRIRASLGSMNAVAGSFAVEAGDLISVVRQAGGAFRGAGGDLNELLAAFTAVRATTRESAEQIGTGLRTIFARLQRKETVDSLRELGVSLRYTREEAEALGQLNLQDQFVGVYESVRRISEGLAELRTTDPRYSSILEELGGYRQISRVIPLLQQFGTAQKALNVARSGSVSLDIAQEQAQDALANKLAKVQENFLSLFRTISEDQSVKAYLDGILGLTNGFIELGKAITPLLPYFALIGAAKFVPSLKGVGSSFQSGAFRGGNKFASGGLVGGNGASDSVPAILPPGSFVIRRDAVNALGPANLKRIEESAEYGVSSLLTPGEYVFGPRAAKNLGSLLPYMNHAEKFAKGGRVRRFADGGDVSGRRSTTTLPDLIGSGATSKLSDAIIDAAEEINKLTEVTSGAIKVIVENIPKPTKKNPDRTVPKFIGFEGIEETPGVHEAVNVSPTIRANVQTNKKEEVDLSDIEPKQAPENRFRDAPRTAEQVRSDIAAEVGRRVEEIFGDDTEVDKDGNPRKSFPLQNIHKAYRKDAAAGAVRDTFVSEDLNEETLRELFASAGKSRRTSAKPTDSEVQREVERDLATNNIGEARARKDDELKSASAKKLREGSVTDSLYLDTAARRLAEKKGVLPQYEDGTYNVQYKSSRDGVEFVGLGLSKQGKIKQRQELEAKREAEELAAAQAEFDRNNGPRVGTLFGKKGEGVPQGKGDFTEFYLEVADAAERLGVAMKDVEEGLIKVNYELENSIPRFRSLAVEQESTVRTSPLPETVEAEKTVRSAIVSEAERKQPKFSSGLRGFGSLRKAETDPQPSSADTPVAVLNPEAIAETRREVEQAQKPAKPADEPYQETVSSGGSTGVIPPVVPPNDTKTANAAPDPDDEKAQKEAKAAAEKAKKEAEEAEQARKNAASMASLGMGVQPNSGASRQTVVQETADAGTLGSKEVPEPSALGYGTQGTPGTRGGSAVGGDLASVPPEKKKTPGEQSVTEQIGATGGINAQRTPTGSGGSAVGTDLRTVPEPEPEKKKTPQEQSVSELIGGPDGTGPNQGARTVVRPIDEVTRLTQGVTEIGEDERQRMQYILREQDAADASRASSPEVRELIDIPSSPQEEIDRLLSEREEVFNRYAYLTEDGSDQQNLAAKRLDEIESRLEYLYNPPDTTSSIGTAPLSEDYLLERSSTVQPGIRIPGERNQPLTGYGAGQTREQLEQEDYLRRFGTPSRPEVPDGYALAQEEFSLMSETQADIERQNRLRRANPVSPPGSNPPGEDDLTISNVPVSQGRSLESLIQERTESSLRNDFSVKNEDGSIKQDNSQFVSSQTRGEYLEKAREQVIQEFIEAQAKQIELLYEGIGSEEALKKATEQAAEARQAIANGQSTGLTVSQDTFQRADGTVGDGRIIGATDTVNNNITLGRNVVSDNYSEPRPQRRSITQVLEARTEKLLKEQFGANASVISEQTRLATMSKVEADLREEFIEVEKRAIQALNKGLTADEAKQIATEKYIAAMDRSAKGLDSELSVVERAEGITASVDTADALAQQGQSAPGAGRGFRIQQGLQRAREGFSRANERFGQTTVGRGINSAFSGNGALLFALAAPALSQGASYLGGSAETAARGDGTRFRAGQAVGGALQSGAIGATLGFTTAGPIGAAVGGVVGGLFGLTNALKDAEIQIREAKIADAIEGFTGDLGQLSRTGNSVVVANSIRDDLSSYRESARERALDEASGYFGSFVGIDFAEAQRAEQRSIRNDLGARLPELSQFVTDSSQQIVRNNPDIAVDDFLTSLREGGNGLNETFLRLIAEIRQVPLDEVLREVTSDMVSFQKTLEVASKLRIGEDATVSTSNSLSRLAQAIDLAAKSFDDLQSDLESRNAFFTGSVQGGEFNLGQINSNTFGRGDNSAVALFEQLSSLGSSGTFRQTAEAADQVARILPSALAEAIRVDGTDSDSVSSRLEKLLRDSLGVNENTSPELRSVINSVVGSASGQLERDGVGEFARTVERDSVVAAQELLAAITEPLIRAGNEASGRISNAMNGILAGQAQAFQQRGIINQTLGRRDDLTLERRLSSADLQRNRRGVTLSELERPFNERLNRLTGGLPANANAIGARLTQNLQDQEAQRARSRDESLTVREQAEAGLELQRLQSEAGQLTSALEQLSNVSARGAGIREKLNQLEEDRAGQFALGERIVLGDAAAQVQLQRGLAIVSQLNQNSNLNGFGSADRNLIASTLKTLGGANIPGKGPADELYRKLIENTTGFPGALPAQQSQRTSLETKLDDYFKEGENALETIANLQKDEHKTFLQGLNSSFSNFEKSLKEALKQNEIIDTENQKNAAGVRLGELERQSESRQRLESFGVTEDVLGRKDAPNDIKKLLELSRDFGRVSSEFEITQERASSLFKRLSESDLDVGENTIFTQGGAFRQYSDEQKLAVQNLLTEEGVAPEIASRVASGIGRNGSNTEETFSRILRSATDSSDQSRLDKSRDELSKARGVVSGYSLDAFNIETRLQDEASQKQFFDDLETFKTPEAFKELPETLGEAASEVEKLKSKVDELKKATPSNPTDSGRPLFDMKSVGLANGGSVFKPRGTDTVPAMLTPNEYVVNAQSAQANFGLLEEINRKKGPVYRAGGGLIGSSSFSSGARRILEFLAGRGYGDGGPETTYDRLGPKGINGTGFFPEENRLESVRLPYKLKRDIQRNINSAKRGGILNAILGALSGGGLLGGALGAAGGYLRDNKKTLHGLLEGGDPDLFATDQLSEKALGAATLQFGEFGENFGRLGRIAERRGLTKEEATKAFAQRYGRLRDNATANTLFQRQLFASSLFPSSVVDQSLAAKQDYYSKRQFSPYFFSQGGLVPGSGSGDNVPAWLESGEYVMDRQTVSRMGGSKTMDGIRRYASGGLVTQGSQSGASGGGDSGLSSAFANFGSSVSILSQSMTVFAGNSAALAEAINSMPRSITIQGQQTHTVVFEGGDFLKELQPGLQKMVIEMTTVQFNKLFREKLPDAGVV